MLTRTACQDRGVIDAQLSRAIVIFVWGTQGRPWPSKDTDAVSAEYGDEAAIEAIGRQFSYNWK